MSRPEGHGLFFTQMVVVKFLLVVYISYFSGSGLMMRLRYTIWIKVLGILNIVQNNSRVDRGQLHMDGSNISSDGWLY